jgi:hypothetical protein
MFAAPLFFKILYVCSTITMYFSRFANHVGDPPPPPQCELLVYQDRRHLFVTPFYQLRVGERKFTVVVYCCTEKCAKTVHTKQIIGAANTAAPALFEILTQFLF